MRYFIIPCLFFVLCLKGQDRDATVEALLGQHRYHEVISVLESEQLSETRSMQLARAYRQSGQTRKALDLLLEIYPKDTTNLNVALTLGETYYGRSQFEQAYLYFRKLITLDTTNSHYQKLAGKSASKIGKLKLNAIFHFSEALRLEPEDRNSAYLLAVNYLDIDEVNLAREISQSFISKDSSDLGMFLLDTRLAYIQGSHKDVISNVNFMMSNGDTVVSMLRLYGGSLYKDKQYLLSKKWLKQSVELAPSDQGLFYLGKSYNKLHQFDSAAYFMELAIKETMSPNLGEYYTHLALTLDNAGEDNKAAVAYDEAYALTENHDLLFRMALLHEDMRHVESAKWHYTKFLERTPDEPTDEREYAKTRLNKLKVADFMDVDD